MTDFQLASQKIVSAKAIQAYDEVTDPAVIEGVRPLAESQLTAMLLRAGCDMDTLDAADAATVAGRLRPVAAALWLAAYWGNLAKDLDAGEGFSSKRDYWAGQVERYRKLLLDEPLSVLGIEDDRPLGNLKYLAGTI